MKLIIVGTLVLCFLQQARCIFKYSSCTPSMASLTETLPELSSWRAKDWLRQTECPGSFGNFTLLLTDGNALRNVFANTGTSFPVSSDASDTPIWLSYLNGEFNITLTHPDGTTPCRPTNIVSPQGNAAAMYRQLPQGAFSQEELIQVGMLPTALGLALNDPVSFSFHFFLTEDEGGGKKVCFHSVTEGTSISPSSGNKACIIATHYACDGIIHVLDYLPLPVVKAADMPGTIKTIYDLGTGTTGGTTGTGSGTDSDDMILYRGVDHHSLSSSSNSCKMSLWDAIQQRPYLKSEYSLWNIKQPAIVRHLLASKASRLTVIMINDDGIRRRQTQLGLDSNLTMPIPKLYSSALYHIIPRAYCWSELIGLGGVNTGLGELLKRDHSLSFSVDNDGIATIHSSSSNSSDTSIRARVVESDVVCGSVLIVVDNYLGSPTSGELSDDDLLDMESTLSPRDIALLRGPVPSSSSSLLQCDDVSTELYGVFLGTPFQYSAMSRDMSVMMRYVVAVLAAVLGSIFLMRWGFNRAMVNTKDNTTNSAVVRGPNPFANVRTSFNINRTNGTVVVERKINVNLKKEKKQQQQQLTGTDIDIKGGEFPPLLLPTANGGGRGGGGGGPARLGGTSFLESSKAALNYKGDMLVHTCCSNISNPSDDDFQGSMMTNQHVMGVDWIVPLEQVQILSKTDGSGKDVVLGRGSQGVVVKGLLSGVHEIAIKKIEQYAGYIQHQAFEKEAEMLQKISRAPNIVQFMGVCFHPKHGMLMLMELMQGGDLYAAMRNDDTKDLVRWSRCGKQVAIDIVKALCFLHANNIIHRDVKSKNVLLGGDNVGSDNTAPHNDDPPPPRRKQQLGAAKLADVATAVVLHGTSVTHDSIYGTLAWAAPELLLNQRCTQKIDIFSLGVILYEICTGATPKRGFMDLPPPCLPDAPPLLIELIQNCLAIDPDERPTAKEVFDRLKSI
jgi:hypothetical protein